MATEIKSAQVGAMQRWRLASGTMFLVNGFVMGSWAPQIPLLLPRHQITESTLGLLIFMLGVGAVGAMALSGGLIARHGSRALLRMFAVAASVTLAGVVLAPNLWIVTPAMVIMGALLGCMDVAMNANAVELERRMGRAIMSSSHGFWSLGGFLGGGIGGWIIAQIGAEGHALVTAGLCLAAVLLAIPYLLGDATPPALHNSSGGKVKRWPRGAAIYILGGMTLLSMVPEGAVLDWAALYLQKEHGTGVSTAGLAFALFSASMAIMRFAGDAIRNRFGAVQTLRISGLIAAAGLMGAAVSPNATLVIACFTFAGLGVANMVPVMFSAAGNFPGLSAGMGITTVTMLGYSGILIAPSSIGFVAEHIGFRVTFGTLALLLISVAMMASRAAAADFNGGLDVGKAEVGA
jgi:MFS family permease